MMIKYFRWIFWHVVYFCQKRPGKSIPLSKLASALCRTERLKPPWWEFKPHVNQIVRGFREWEVLLANDMYYARTGQSLNCDLYISHGTGKIIGFCFSDEDLELPLTAELGSVDSES